MPTGLEEAAAGAGMAGKERRLPRIRHGQRMKNAKANVQSERSGELADTTDASIQFEQDGALQTQSATDEPVTHRDDSPARKSATDTGVTEANAAEGDGPEAPGDAAPAEPPTGQEAPARYDPPFEQARTNAGARGAAKSPTARTKSRKKPTAAQPGVLGESGGTPRALPDGRVTPMAVREEPVVPSHYTLPESHTIVVDEIRAVLRRPPYRYTKRQASQSNVVAIAIERLYRGHNRGAHASLQRRR